MKRRWAAAAAFALVFLFTSTGEAGLVLNEIYLNPPGTDDNREYVEIRGAAGDSLSNTWLLEIEGDGTSAGSVDMAVNLSSGSLSAAGLLVVGQNYQTSTPWGALPNANKLNIVRTPTTMENGNITFLLVTGFTGTVGTDYDTDGTPGFDTTPWTSILDSVGWIDPSGPGTVYSAASLTQSSGTPDGASRFPTDLTPNSLNAWFDGDILALGGTPDLSTGYDLTKASANIFTGARITPGEQNVPEPATLFMLLAAAGLIRRQR